LNHSDKWVDKPTGRDGRTQLQGWSLFVAKSHDFYLLTRVVLCLNDLVLSVAVRAYGVLGLIVDRVVEALAHLRAVCNLVLENLQDIVILVDLDWR